MPKSKVNQAHAQALARVELAKMRIAAFSFAVKGLRNKQRFLKDPNLDAEFNAVHRYLYQDLNDAFRDSLMWGAFNPRSPLAKEGVRQALKHYAKEGMELMSWLDLDRLPPVEYLSKDLDQFRGELDGIMAEHGLAPDGHPLPDLADDLYTAVGQVLRLCEKEANRKGKRAPQYLLRVRSFLRDAKAQLFRRRKNPAEEG